MYVILLYKKWLELYKRHTRRYKKYLKKWQKTSNKMILLTKWENINTIYKCKDVKECNLLIN